MVPYLLGAGFILFAVTWIVVAATMDQRRRDRQKDADNESGKQQQ